MKNIFVTSAGAKFAPGLSHGNRDDRPYLFLLFSVIIHILVLWALTIFGAGSLMLFEVPVQPIDIEIVELPENFRGQLKTPDKVSAFAQRSQEVEKEEYPVKSESVKITPVPPAVVALIVPGGGGQAEDIATKKSIIKESKDKVSDEGIKKEDALSPPSSKISLMPDILRPTAGSKVNGSEGAGAGTGTVWLFPTEQSLQQIAREEQRDAVDSPREGSGMTLLLNTSEFKYQKYFMNVKRRIQFYWEYPALAARNGQQGRLNIDFVIHKDGVIDTNGIDIIKSSNYPILDDAATTALRLASPFNPFPEGFDIEEITVHGSFEYSLIRSR